MSAILETTDRPDSSVMPRWPVRRFTVAEYRSMVESGALEEDDRIELLQGWIVPKMVHNPPHDWTVMQVHDVIKPLLPDAWLMRVQCAINTGDSEPEPDDVIALGPNDRYLHRHPRGGDIGLLVDVADSSLARDRDKAEVYAAEGVPVYWIINLNERQIEVHRDPDPAAGEYRHREVFPAGTQVTVSIGEANFAIDVDELLPPMTA
jgi:Uma2 family endonuclease